MSLPVAILAGGKATRLRPLTDGIPKALIEINGLPFLAHQLELLRASGLFEIVICAWYQGEKIQAYAGDGRKFGVRIHYSFDGESLMGTGGAIKKAIPFLGDTFFVLYGDSYLPCDYSTVEKAFYVSRKDGVMTLYHNKDLGDKSNVHFSNGNILAYDKNNQSPEMEYIDYGLGILKSQVFASYPSTKPFDLMEVYQQLIKENRILGYEVKNRFYEIGSFAGIKTLENYLIKKQGVNIND